jgi:HK97 family phage portal protein
VSWHSVKRRRTVSFAAAQKFEGPIQHLVNIARQVQKDAPYQFINENRASNYQQMVNTFEAYAQEGYEQNALVQAAIMYKMRAIAMAPLRAYTPDEENPEIIPTQTPIQHLMRNPNMFMSGRFLQMTRVMMQDISGNSYIYIDMDNRGNPVGLYPLRPDRVRVVPMPDNTVGYYYIPDGKTYENGVPILPEQMIHDKLPNPLDRYEGAGLGLSPLSASAFSIDVDNKFSRFLNNLVENGVMPTGLVKSMNKLSQKDADRARRLWRERYGGVDNWADVMVLDNSMDYERIGMTLEEMVAENVDKRNEARILMTIGVSPILIGALLGMENSTYANFEEANSAFWQNVMLFYLMLFEDEYNQRLSMNGQYQFKFDLSGIPALREDIGDRTQAAHTLWQMGTPLNLAVKTAGITMEEVEGGDVSYISAALVDMNEEPEPVPDELQPFQNQPDNDDMPDEDNEDEQAELSMPREAIKAMIRRQIHNLRGSELAWWHYETYYDAFAVSSYADILKQYNVTPNHQFFIDLNAQLKQIAVNIAKSGEIKHKSAKSINDRVIVVMQYIIGEALIDNAPNALVSQKTLSQIQSLAQTVQFGNVSKASTTILFVDGDVMITEADVDAAIEDVVEDELVYGLLTSDVEDEDE